MFGKRLKSRFAWFLVAGMLLAILLAGCAGNNGSNPSGPAPTPDNGKQPLVSAQPVAWNSNGTVADNEYSQFQQIGPLQVFTRVEGDQVCMALRAQNNGYIALGIRPDFKMQGADDIICAISGGTVSITDAYSTGAFGPHPLDTELGGSNNILDPSGSQSDGWVTFEFKRQLVTGDNRDKPLTIGDNPVIWSVGRSADTSIQHTNRGSGTLTLR